MQFKQRSDKVQKLLMALMARLEKDKAGAGIGDRSNDAEYCRSFAEEVFNRADRTDRAGRATKNTAVTFVAASFFIDVATFRPPVPVHCHHYSIHHQLPAYCQASWK